MAAVVSSLAAVFIGCNVPGIPDVSRQVVVKHDPEGLALGAGECPSTPAWRQAEQESGMEVAGAVADAMVPQQVKRHLAKALADGASVRCACTDFEGALAATSSSVRPALRPQRSRKTIGGHGLPHAARKVRFDLSRKTEHEVTPYSEVYGVHPRDFDFGARRFGAEAPEAWRFVDPAGGGEDALRVLGLGGTPRHVYCTLLVLSLVVHALGADVVVDACAQLARATRI